MIPVPQTGPGVHPLARASVARSRRHPIYDNFRPGVTERINVVADSSEFAPYPGLPPERLQARYREFLEKSAGAPLPRAAITFTRGAAEGLELLVRAFCEPGGDAVVVTPPDFPEYERLAALNGNEVLRVPLEGENFDSLPVWRLAAADAKLLFLCNPNNPVGSILPLKQIEAVLKTFKGVVAVDEVYAELAGAEFRSALPLVSDYANLAVVRSFSKAWAMAGLRVGAVIGGAALVDAVRRLQNPFSLSTPVLNALEGVLSKWEALSSRVSLMRRRRDALAERLSRLPAVKKVFPSHANFVLAAVSGLESRCRKLQDGHCLYVNADRQVRDCVQLTAGSKKEVDAIIAALSVGEVEHGSLRLSE